ncbi:hypothetical protein BD413DRAFT_603588 [Trametes elegans]|nr:hypothetical protein BD413DRAFT_603588 [Trametes elegans]
MAEESRPEPVIASVAEIEPVTTIPCAICRRQFSRYTCPRCNIPYCSLVCFRSEKHGDCSESFYRKEVELDVKSAPSANVEEKRRMMDLLKRFEEDALDESPLLADEEEDSADDLQKRLQHIDLDCASYEELWSALTPAEREKFLRALDDPNSELAQQLLASEELEREQVDPWWDAAIEPDLESVSPTATTTIKRRRGSKPGIMSLPAPLVKQSANTALSGPLLLYNICAVCITYAYVVRYFSISPVSATPPSDPDRPEIRRSISQLVPFLTDRRSTLVYSSLSGVVTDLWSRFPPGHMNSRFFSLLLNDTAALLRPAHVTVLPQTDSTFSPEALEAHPSANALRVLSDLADFFNDTRASEPEGTSVPLQSKASHIAHKLTFYAAYILGTPAPMLRVLADEAAMAAKALGNEAKQESRDGSQSVERAREMQRSGRGAKIEQVT